MDREDDFIGRSSMRATENNPSSMPLFECDCQSKAFASLIARISPSSVYGPVDSPSYNTLMWKWGLVPASRSR